MIRLSLSLLLLLVFPLLACSTEDECDRFTFNLAPQAAANHISCTSTACGNGMNPPTAGPHCSDTLACQVYDTEQPPCVWLHNLEHGHAVFLYNCPEGCPEEVARLEQAPSLASRAALPERQPGIPAKCLGFPARAGSVTGSI
jgi:hypothetical protein